MNQLLKAMVVGSLLVGSACGGDDGTGPAENDAKTMTVTVGGRAITASNFSGPLALNNRFLFSGSQIVGGTTYKLDFNMNPLSVGTFTVGPGTTNVITYSETTGGVTTSWTSALAGASGAVQITTFSSNRVAGSVAATLSPNLGAVGTKAGSGTFDLEIE